jgi:alpha-mannosidase
MKPDASHIRQIKVVSNTHWDREFRRSFEKTRRRLLDMLDVTLGILERDPAYHSFTLDGHSILLDDYLEMRPERRALVEDLVRAGRLIIGPWYTLVEEFSVGHEALVRNLLFGRKTVEKYGG